MPDITAILTLALGFISLCMTIHKSISSSQQMRAIQENHR